MHEACGNIITEAGQQDGQMHEAKDVAKSR